ncbi:hypothetical protein H1C71_001702 [Ictidomys tridecemlineatus]|nr:hypothetical protein H1C71_001702 [Ictidomys tridecemlineatus]KAG3265257.1 hypothetical protein H1C71_001702 [Ictidomys tridecemlineatus]
MHPPALTVLEAWRLLPSPSLGSVGPLPQPGSSLSRPLRLHPAPEALPTSLPQDATLSSPPTPGKTSLHSPQAQVLCSRPQVDALQDRPSPTQEHPRMEEWPAMTSWVDPTLVQLWGPSRVALSGPSSLSWPSCCLVPSLSQTGGVFQLRSRSSKAIPPQVSAWAALTQ